LFWYPDPAVLAKTDWSSKVNLDDLFSFFQGFLFKNGFQDNVFLPFLFLFLLLDYYIFQDSVVAIFPPFFQEQHKLDTARVKYTSSVNIDPFQLITPDKSQVLLERTELILEQNKK
jgi:hypothetical protein